MKSHIRNLLWAFLSASMVGVSAAHADVYQFSYTYGEEARPYLPGTVLSGAFEGESDPAIPGRVNVYTIMSAQLLVPEVPGVSPGFTYVYPIDVNAAVSGSGSGSQAFVDFDGKFMYLDVCIRINGSLANCEFSNDPDEEEFGFRIETTNDYRADPDTSARLNYDAETYARVRAEYNNDASNLASISERSDYLYHYDDESGELAGPGNFYEQDSYRDWFYDRSEPVPELFATLQDGRVVPVEKLLIGEWQLTQTGGGGGSIDPSARVSPNATVDDSVNVGANSVIRSGASIGVNTNIGDDVRVRRDATIGSDVEVADNVVVARDVQIGSNTILGDSSKVRRETVVGSEVSIGANASIGNSSEIGDRVSMGANSQIRNTSVVGDDASIGEEVRVRRESVICPGVEIGDGATIRRSALVDRDVAPGEVYRGGEISPEVSDCDT